MTKDKKAYSNNLRFMQWLFFNWKVKGWIRSRGSLSVLLVHQLCPYLLFPLTLPHSLYDGELLQRHNLRKVNKQRAGGGSLFSVILGRALPLLPSLSGAAQKSPSKARHIGCSSRSPLPA